MGLYEINVAQSMAAERADSLARDAELRRIEKERPTVDEVQPVRLGLAARITEYFHSFGWHLPHPFAGRRAVLH